MKTNKTMTPQEAYVRRHRRTHHLITLTRILLLVCFLILWETASACKWIDSFFFSSPSLVVKCFLDLLSTGQLWMHISVTLLETFLSFLLVMLISFAAAIILWFFPKVSKCLEPFLVVLNSLPKSALAPLFLVWLGTGMKTIVVAGISVAVFGSVISFYTAFTESDEAKLILIRTLGGTRLQEFRYVVFPSSLPTLLSTAKVNIGLTLVGVIIGEFLAAKRGLGYLIIYGSQVFQLNLVITSIMILCLIATLLYQTMEILIHRFKKSYHL